MYVGLEFADWTEVDGSKYPLCIPWRRTGSHCYKVAKQLNKVSSKLLSANELSECEAVAEELLPLSKINGWKEILDCWGKWWLPTTQRNLKKRKWKVLILKPSPQGIEYNSELYHNLQVSYQLWVWGYRKPNTKTNAVGFQIAPRQTNTISHVNIWALIRRRKILIILTLHLKRIRRKGELQKHKFLRNTTVLPLPKVILTLFQGKLVGKSHSHPSLHCVSTQSETSHLARWGTCRQRRKRSLTPRRNWRTLLTDMVLILFLFLI